MTRIYAEVYKLKSGALQAARVSSSYGQGEAERLWMARASAYNDVLMMLDEPDFKINWWKKLVCSVLHQKHSLKCPNCGGQW